MRRKIYEKLKKWKDTNRGRTALMLDGARRVGKSWIVEEFARREYDKYLLIDFATAPKAVKELFDDYLDNLDTFFMYLLNSYHVTLPPRKSVIIFDEVQRFPRAREAIKYLVKDGRYDYIETGSLISIQRNVKNIVIPSEEHHLEMFPMDFEEFLWATGNDGLQAIIQDAFVTRHAVGDGIHRRIMDVLRQYLVVGGMPQVVEAFVQTHDFKRVDAVKRDILSLYRADILKFGGHSKHRILSVFNAIPGMLSKHERRFSPGEVCMGSGMREFYTSFEWLKASMIVNVAYASTEPNIGLELTCDHTSLKCYLADSGLFVSMAFSERELASGDIQERLLKGRLEVNVGMLYETLVAQMLRAAGNQLFFYASDSRSGSDERMEIDFLIARSDLQRRHNIQPIEVKGTGEYETKSLSKFIRKYGQYLGDACVLHTKDLSREADCVHLPVYMAGIIGL